MAPEQVTHTHDKSLSALGPLALALLLIIYAGGMLALPVYFFGLQAGLWLSVALLAGGVSLLVVLSGANRTRNPASESAPQGCAVHATPPPPRTWVPPRTIPFQ
jgi:hypothetical protein